MSYEVSRTLEVHVICININVIQSVNDKYCDI